MIPPDIFPWSHRMIFEYFEIVRIGFFSSQSNNNYKSTHYLSSVWTMAKTYVTVPQTWKETLWFQISTTFLFRNIVCTTWLPNQWVERKRLEFYSEEKRQSTASSSSSYPRSSAAASFRNKENRNRNTITALIKGGSVSSNVARNNPMDIDDYGSDVQSTQSEQSTLSTVSANHRRIARNSVKLASHIMLTPQENSDCTQSSNPSRANSTPARRIRIPHERIQHLRDEYGMPTRLLLHHARQSLDQSHW